MSLGHILPMRWFWYGNQSNVRAIWSHVPEYSTIFFQTQTIYIAQTTRPGNHVKILDSDWSKIHTMISMMSAHMYVNYHLPWAQCTVLNHIQTYPKVADLVSFQKYLCCVDKLLLPHSHHMQEPVHVKFWKMLTTQKKVQMLTTQKKVKIYAIFSKNYTTILLFAYM